MLIASIHQAVLEGSTFDIGYDRAGEKIVEKFSPARRLLYLGDSNYQEERAARIAKVLNKALEKLPRMPIVKAMGHETVECARLFLRTLGKHAFQKAEIRLCSRLLLAAKLGLDLDVLNQNPDFEAFAFKTHLDRYLLHYETDVKANEQKELLILCEGTYQPWKEVFAKWKALEPPPSNSAGNPKLLWNFGQKGIQKMDMYAWHEWTPYKVEENHDWGDRYIFEFSVCCSKSVAMNGDHAWLRLKTPKGEIYCIGLYRQGKNDWRDNFHFPMRIKKGYLMSPDVSEFWPMPVYRIPVEITKEQFEKVKASVEEDKANEEMLAFQLFNGNCTEYVVSKAAIVGIKLPTALNYLKNITPPQLQALADAAMYILPPLVNLICCLALTILSNLLQLSLGAHLVDDKLKGKKFSISPHIHCAQDIFNPDKLKFHPPRHLALEVGTKIEKWRDRQKARIEKLCAASQKMDLCDKAKEEIRFKLPKEYWVNTQA